MSIIPATDKVYMVREDVDTTYGGSKALNVLQNWYTMQDIVDTVGGGSGLGYLGSFYDTTNQTGIVNSVLTMGLNNSDPWNNGVSIVSGNRITIANPGVYNIQFSAQMVKNAGNTATHAHIWLSQNGVDVPISASQIGFPSNTVYVVAAWNFFFKTTVANEYVQLKWEINSNANNAVAITSAAASGTIPAIPGLIVTVNKVG